MEESILFVCNPEQISWFKTEYIVPLYSPFQLQELSHLLTGKPIQGVMLMEDLAWKESLEVVCFLRQELKLRCPILLLNNPHSDATTLREQLLSSRYERDIALGRINSERVKGKKMTTIRSLLPAPIPDAFSMNEHLQYIYKDYGFVSELFHDLMRKMREDGAEQYPAILKEGRRLLSLNFPTLEPLIDQLSHEAEDRLKAGFCLDKAAHLMEMFRDELKYKIRQARTQEPPTASPHKIHLLLIDDDRSFFVAFSRQVSWFNIHCEYASDGDAAERFLQENNTPTTVVICDYRFYMNGKLAREQGVHIMDRLAALPNRFELFSLTDLGAGTAKKVVRLRGKRVTPFLKRDLLYSMEMVDAIKQADTRVRKQIQDASGMKEPFLSLMKTHQHSAIYDAFEQETNALARKVFQAILAGKSTTFLKINGYQGGINYARNPDLNLRNFRKKLKGRRLALALIQLESRHLKKYHPLKACSSLRDKWESIVAVLTHQEKHSLRDFVNASLQLSYKSAYTPYDLSGSNLFMEERSFIGSLAREFDL